MMQNKEGFGLPLVIVTMVLIGVMSAAGWTVYQSIQPVEVTSTSESVQTEIDTDSDETKLPEGWTVFNAENYGFSFAYPESWGEASLALSGPGFDDCAGSCGETLAITFSAPDAAVEIRGRTIDYHLGKDSDDYNGHQKGYTLENGEILAYSYSPISKKGDVPDQDKIEGEVRNNSNDIEYVFQISDQSQNPFVANDYDISNLHSALINLPTNERGIRGLAISVGVTESSTGTFEKLIDSFSFKSQ